MPVLIFPKLGSLFNLGLGLIMFFTIAACGRIGRLEPPPDYQPPPASPDRVSTQKNYISKAMKKTEQKKQALQE